MSAESVHALARATAVALRLGMTAGAGQQLARLVDALTVELATRPDVAARVAPLLGEVVAAQQRGDAIGVADRLEHELPVLLG